MLKLIANFSQWKQVNEAESPGRTKQTAGMGQRIVGIPIDEKSFKIKVIRDLDVLDSTGKLTTDTWNSILGWIKEQPKWLPYYPGLNDLKTNFVIYSVNRDNDRKQIMTFTISPRTAAPGLPAEVQIVKQEDLPTVIKDAQKATILANQVQGAENTKVDTTVPKVETKPVEAEKKPLVINLEGKSYPFDQISKFNPAGNFFKAVKNAYFTIAVDPEASSNPILPKVKAELKANLLGPESAKFVKAIIAGFDLKDEYGDRVEVIDQDVANAIAQFPIYQRPVAQNASREYFIDLDGRIIFEQAEAAAGNLPKNFNVKAFIDALAVDETPKETTASTDTGDITIPDGGIKRGVKKDEQVKKVQQLILSKFEKALGDTAPYQDLKRVGATGNYLNITAILIAMIKAGFELSDTNGDIITKEVVIKMMNEKIDESYLGISGQLYEKFNIDAAKAIAANYKQTQKSTSSPSGGAGNEGKVNTKIDEAARKLAQALYDTVKEDEKAIVEVFEKDITSKSELKSLLNYWDSLKIPSYSGFVINVGDVKTSEGWEKFKKYCKENYQATDDNKEDRKVGKTLQFSIMRLLDSEERKPINDVIKQYASGVYVAKFNEFKK